MNEQIKTIIDRARELVAAATQRPWRNGTGTSVVADVPVPEMSGSDELRFYGGHLVGESIVERNADAIVFAVNNIGTLCDAVGDAERRAAETDAQAAAMREALVEIGREWTIDEDGCAFCGDGLGGDHDGCPGMIASKALANPAGRALLDRLHAAETRVADLESVREEQAAKLRRHLDELQAATAYIKDLEAENAQLEGRAAGLCTCMAAPFAESKGASDCPECKGEGAVIIDPEP